MLGGFLTSTRNLTARLSADADDIIIGDSDTTFHATSDNNIAIGVDALANTYANSDDNIMIGAGAGGGTWVTAASSGNIGIGSSTLDAALNTQVGAIAIGHQTLTKIQGGLGNTAVGYKSMSQEVAGTHSVALGYEALKSLTGGIGNVAIGYQAMDTLDDTADTLSSCVAIGKWAFRGSATATTDAADGTVAIGSSALTALTIGAYNTAVGYLASTLLLTGQSNTVLGWSALSSADGAESNNVAIGKSAGDVIDGDGSDNIIIGTNSDPSTAAAANQTVIGHATTGIANDTITLGNADVTDVYMASDSATGVGAKVHCGDMVSSGQTNSSIILENGSTYAGSQVMEYTADGLGGYGAYITFCVYFYNDGVAEDASANKYIWTGTRQAAYNSETNKKVFGKVLHVVGKAGPLGADAIDQPGEADVVADNAFVTLDATAATALDWAIKSDGNSVTVQLKNVHASSAQHFRVCLSGWVNLLGY